MKWDEKFLMGKVNFESASEKYHVIGTYIHNIRLFDLCLFQTECLQTCIYKYASIYSMSEVSWTYFLSKCWYKDASNALGMSTVTQFLLFYNENVS